jgi:hypothetical protein
MIETINIPDRTRRSFREPLGWLCPVCEKGSLHTDVDLTVNVEAFINQASKVDLDSHKYDHIEFDQIEVPFAYSLRCIRRPCSTEVLVYGRKSLDRDHDGVRYNHVITGFEPSIPLFRTLDVCEFPDSDVCDVEGTLKRAFKLFWVDTNSCFVTLRIFCELTLDAMNIPKTVVAKDGKKRSDLSARIEAARTSSNISSRLLDDMDTLRHPGNGSAHSTNPISNSTLKAALIVVETLCRELYSSTLIADQQNSARARLSAYKTKP